MLKPNRTGIHQQQRRGIFTVVIFGFRDAIQDVFKIGRMISH